MALLPEPVLKLTACLSQLPGIGPRSAERLALHIIQADQGRVQQLAEALTAARERVGFCNVCGGFTEHQPCELCSSDSRDKSQICVVERAVDLLTVEKSGAFRGLYHVLGGKLSPLNGVEPEDLRIKELESRIGSEQVREIILALGTDVEGDATGIYLAKKLSGRGVTVTRIAHGMPAGSGIDYADEVTLGRALEGRREIPGTSR